MNSLKVEEAQIDFSELPRFSSHVGFGTNIPPLSRGYEKYFLDSITRNALTPYKNELPHPPEFDSYLHTVFNCINDECRSLGINEEEINRLVPQLVHVFGGDQFHELNKSVGVDSSKNFGGIRDNEIHIALTSSNALNKYLIIHEAWHLMAFNSYNIKDFNYLKFESDEGETLKGLYDERNKLFDLYADGKVSFEEIQRELNSEKYKNLSMPSKLDFSGLLEIGKNRVLHFKGINEAVTERLALDTVNKIIKN